MARKTRRPEAPDFDDLIQELIADEKANGSSTGKTCYEWANTWGCGYSKARKIVKMMLLKGAMVLETDMRESVLRRGIFPITVYRVL